MKLWQPAALFAAILVGLYGTSGYGWDKEGYDAQVGEAAQVREEMARKIKAGGK